MYKPMNDRGYPPQGNYPQEGYSPKDPYPQGGQPPQGASPQSGFLQGGYPPQSGFPQGGYPPQSGFPQGGYPPQSGFPQGGYPPQGDKVQGAYPPPPPGAYPPPAGPYSPAAGPYPTPPGFQPGFPNDGYGMPADSTFGEDVDVKGFDFNEKSIRRAFIRKVYGILMSQLMVSLAFISVFTFHEPTKYWVARNPAVLIVALVVMVVCIIAMSCCEAPRRKAPMNLIFLGVFTLAESLLLGVASSRYDSEVVMMAVGITAVICLALTIFAMQTRFDFTVIGGGLFCALIVLVLFGLLAIFFRNHIMNLLYASLGALLFSLYLIYDTQLMMGGKHKYTISPEEYVFAALNLYLDIINMFLYILRIIGAAKS